ncbi:MAG: hypothetical protein KIT27_11205 [Legionellales bacterium]|nr:hypothetical protein [Legionellales bacterium]
MRQFIAIKHYNGDLNYSFYDLTQEFFSKNREQFQIEGGWVKNQENISDREVLS